MNLVKHNIIEVYDISTIDIKGGNNDKVILSFVRVDVLVECCGKEQRVQTSFSNMEEWEKIKDQGYFFA